MASSDHKTVTAEQFLLELWQQNQAAISRTLMASEADPAARQDLKQDIYLALHQSAERIQAAEMPRAYLFRIVHNVTVDHIARAKRQQRYTRKLYFLYTPTPTSARRWIWGNLKRVSATACCWCRRPQDHVC